MSSSNRPAPPHVTRRGIPAAIALALVVGLLAATATPASILPFPDRPPLGHTGGFGEPTCVRCHAGSALNSEGGTLALLGMPAAYEPAQRYRLSLSLDRRGMRRSGFQLAIRFAEGELAGTEAGKLRVLDERAQLGDSLSVTYAFHTSAGSGLAAPNQSTWTLEWTAPRDGGRVVAHVVATAANDDASELGDFVYADSVASEPAR